MTKTVPPAVDRKSFSCPVCGALADQRWFRGYGHPVRDEGLPTVITAEQLQEVADQIKHTRKQVDNAAADDFAEVLRRFKRCAAGDMFLSYDKEGTWGHFDLPNLFISRCFSCKEVTLWRHDTVLYPPPRYEIEPNSDMDVDIQADFNEARTVLDLSPRAAAALLRLCVQKLCKQLGLPGQNINEDIGALVKRGLDPNIQRALDVVRVVGNNAVHPGAIDLKDDRATAAKLFAIVNRIAFDMLTHPKEVKALFDEKVPEPQKQQIAKRDGSGTP